MKSPRWDSLAPLNSLTDNILRLLTHVIMADGHVFESEVDALVRGAIELRLKDESRALLNETDIRIWFDAYQLTLDVQIPALRPEITLTRILLDLDRWPHKFHVVDVLREISIADGDFHPQEKSLISLVRDFWSIEDLDAPNEEIQA